MIVGILGPGGCGGTFLDWSIQFLSGSTENLVVVPDRPNRGIFQQTHIQSISNNPLKGATAHGYKKTHPNIDLLPIVIDIFLTSKYLLNTFYYVDDATQINYNNIIKTYPTVKFISYNFSQNHVDLIFYLQYEKIDNVVRSFNTLVGNSSLNLSTGELREILSLFYPGCIKGQMLNETLEDADNLYKIDFDSVWSNLDIVMFDIFEFLGLSIDKSRYPEWINVYHKWLEKNKTDFFYDLPEIVNCIVNNTSMNLEGYDITFAKEVVIASKLLYNHNLALKFDSVTDLTSNTLQWHSILEENTYHNLEIGKA